MPLAAGGFVRRLPASNSWEQSPQNIPPVQISGYAPGVFIADKFDVLRGRLLGNRNDFHWQLGGQINHQPCSYKVA